MRISNGNQLSPTQNLIAGGAQASARNEAANTDPYWANVVLLAGNENGANATTSFTDQSGSAHTLTATGNIQWSTSQYPTGMTSSILCDGTGDYLGVATSADWSFGTGDFTVEFMVRKAGGNSAMTGWATNGTYSWTPIFFSGQLYWQINVETTNLYSRAATSVEDSAWHHIAVTRTGTTNRMFFDGVKQGADVSDSNDYSKQDMNRLFSDATYALNGYVSNFRITKGVARYTTNFTPPTLPMPTS